MRGNDDMKLPKGKVLTVRGPVDPLDLGRVLMHEHLHCDIYDWEKMELITEEKPITAQRCGLLFREAVPLLEKCADYGCHAFVDATPSPWRAWPTFYVEASKAANIHIILCTGFYREVEVGTYWVKTQEDAIWSFVKKASVEELADFCIKEILEGVHGTKVHAGAIKLASSQPKMTEAEEKIFVAGAQAQKQTGVHITTHCTKVGAETSQLQLLLDEGVDLNRVIVGHTSWHLMNDESRKVCIEWMERGANFLPTNLAITEDHDWRPLIEAIHGIFDIGLGDKILFGLDHGYVSESRPFSVVSFMPPPPFVYIFTHVLPAFRKLGLTEEEEETIMIRNPQRILPIK
jgi:phosphotriesterase-related protein